jgi:hypothetical protein
MTTCCPKHPMIFDSTTIVTSQAMTPIMIPPVPQWRRVTTVSECDVFGLCKRVSLARMSCQSESIARNNCPLLVGRNAAVMHDRPRLSAPSVYSRQSVVVECHVDCLPPVSLPLWEEHSS